MLVRVPDAIHAPARRLRWRGRAPAGGIAPHGATAPVRCATTGSGKLWAVNSTTYNLALTLHLLGVITFAAGIVLAGVAFEVARRRSQPPEIALLLSITRVGVLLVAVGTLLIGAFGLWLVHLGRWGYGSGWVDTSIGLFVAALVLGGLGGRRPKQARRLAVALAEQRAPVSAELKALLDDPASLAVNYGALALMVAIVVIMVFKP